MTCSHCPAESSTEWTLRACAEGRKRRVIPLCKRCDIDLNRMVLAFANVPDLDAVMQRYEAAA